jgi:hypothetical protein
MTGQPAEPPLFSKHIKLVMILLDKVLDFTRATLHHKTYKSYDKINQQASLTSACTVLGAKVHAELQNDFFKTSDLLNTL